MAATKRAPQGRVCRVGAQIDVFCQASPPNTFDTIACHCLLFIKHVVTSLFKPHVYNIFVICVLIQPRTIFHHYKINGSMRMENTFCSSYNL